MVLEEQSNKELAILLKSLLAKYDLCLLLQSQIVQEIYPVKDAIDNVLRILSDRGEITINDKT